MPLQIQQTNMALLRLCLVLFTNHMIHYQYHQQDKILPLENTFYFCATVVSNGKGKILLDTISAYLKTIKDKNVEVDD